jgi:serine/threonine protein kinase/Flp pilus assembly protein TadD
MGSSTFQIRETKGVPTPPTAGAGEQIGAFALVQRLAEQMVERWRWGERPLAEEFLERHPELSKQPEAAIELIYEEICLRREYGQASATPDVLERFPQWRAQLQVLLDCHELLEQAPAAHDFPEPGESLGDFQLLTELGRGGRGRVFLATQPALAGRSVVVKVTPQDGREHLSLGRLQHTHIVPLYSVQDHPHRNLRALCMPYFGGATLAWVLAALRETPVGKRSGADLLKALDRAPSRDLLAMPVEGPARRVLAGASYVRAMCWLGGCLADALQYAQERNLVHLDVKPSNVLLAADGQPMLLDFHLASEPIRPEGPLPDWLGGTPAYMSPEQQLALAAARAGRPIGVLVDGRSDIYSLGLVLHEALSGRLPPPCDEAGPHLRQRNPQVSVGLADVLSRCLSRNAAARYQTAAELAVDLRRHLADLPLQGVANRSVAERWRKWRRRRPYALLLGGLLVGAVSAGFFELAYIQQQGDRARNALEEGRRQFSRSQYNDAVTLLNNGVLVAGSLPGYGDLTRELQASLDQARRAQEVQHLHAFVDQLRRLYGEEIDSRENWQAKEYECRHFWSRRQSILDPSGPRLSVRMEQQIFYDYLDLAIVWGDLRVRLASPEDVAATRREVWQLFAWAEGLFGPSVVLDRERQAYAEALGLMEVARAAAERAAQQVPRTAWEHYALGRSLLRSGNLEKAVAAFDRALDKEPQSLWANFYKGKCAYQLKRYDEAVAAFFACIVLEPNSLNLPNWYYERARSYAGMGNLDKAYSDYDRALELNPGFANALVKRGMLHYQTKRYDKALEDLQSAQAYGTKNAQVHYNLGLVYHAQHNDSAARASVQQALQADPNHKDALALQKQLNDRARISCTAEPLEKSSFK